MGNELRQALSDAHEALESIALAGMSGSGQESEEGMQRWHAQRAWDFISIAARALDPIKTALAASAAVVPADERVKAEPAASEPLFLIVGGGDQISTEIVPLSRLDTAYLLMQWGDLDPDDDQQREALEHFHDPDEWQYMDPLRGGEGRVPTIFSIAFEDGGVSVYRLPDAAPQPAAPHPPTDTSREQGAPGKWEGAEEWMPLAWELCANECGEDACTELIWEGGPIKEPWGDRWLKYEDQAKEMIAMVRKHVPATLPTDTSAARPEQVEIIARWACDLTDMKPDQVLDVNPTKLVWHRYDRMAAALLSKILAAQPASTPDAAGLTTCNCRWRGEKLVQQCTLHEAHRDAIHEWAARAKAAERKLETVTSTRSWEATAAELESQGHLKAADLCRENAATPTQPVEKVPELTGDMARAIARTAMTSASDSPSPCELVAAGWRAALAASRNGEA